MRYVLTLVVAACVAGVATANMAPPGPRLPAPGGWCGGLLGGLMGGAAVTLGGLWLFRRPK
jgi:predicted lipid-binding transport protein (Tim44 family)